MTDTWTEKQPMGVPRAALGGSVNAEGNIYAIGGYVGGVPQQTDVVEEYNPLTNTWTSRTPLPVATMELGAALGSDGKVYAIGGYTPSSQAVTSNYAGFMPQVVDTTPPIITVAASPETLWPPNGKMVPVTISGTITDAGSGVKPSTAAYAVTDEYGLVHPSGPVPLGANGTYAFTIQLQASRNGNDKNGRQYTITIGAKDNAGNPGSAATGVTVPHDQGH